MSRIIMHVDLNAFFATAEEIRNPSYVGKAIIVCSFEPRGVVSTASYEARKYGVHSAMPTYQAREKCPQGIFVEGDYAYYDMLSQSFFAYIRGFATLVEEASIDECYADMSKALSQEKNPEQYLRNLQKGLLDRMGLKCSIGVAPTKFLAKMASDMKKPMGLTILRRKDLPSKLYPLPIESFYGIGKKTSPLLREMGIATIWDLKKGCDRDDPALMRLLGKFYFVIKDWVNGRGNDKVDPTPFDPKSIGHSETFPYDTSDEEEIKAEITSLAKEVAEGAKRDGKKGRTVQLVIKDKDFKTHDKSVSFKEATDSYDVILAKALDLYEQHFLGMLIRLVGVTLQNLLDPKAETVQMSFWNYGEYEEMDKTKLLVNELNRKMKKPALVVASEMKDNHGHH
jgi:DNA polymerase IV